MRAALGPRLLRALLWIAPTHQHAVVSGFPDEEGNSVEVVRALARRIPTYWLVGGDPDSLRWLIADAPGSAAVRCLRKDTPRAFLTYLTARYVFFTHGLYGSVQPPHRKTVVNLWHGDGPKARKGFADIRSTWVVSGTELWGRPRADHFGVGEHGVLVTGNPRVDQLARPAEDDDLVALGVDPDRPLVLWLPTYRTTDFRGNRLGAVRNWSDGPELSESSDVRPLLGEVAAVARDLGITLIVKPHPLDSDRYTRTGIRCLTGADLARTKVPLYRLLGRTRGLITDYSSVWTDYLALDRPIGFYCPDLAEYEEERGLNVPDYAGLLPGPLLEGVDDFDGFLTECLAGSSGSLESSGSRERRLRCIEAIGAEVRPGATERLLAALRMPPA